MLPDPRACVSLNSSKDMALARSASSSASSSAVWGSSCLRCSCAALKASRSWRWSSSAVILCASCCCHWSSSMVCMPGMRPVCTWRMTSSYACRLVGGGMCTVCRGAGAGSGCWSRRCPLPSPRIFSTARSISSSWLAEARVSTAPNLAVWSQSTAWSLSSSSSSSWSSAGRSRRARRSAAALSFSRTSRSCLIRAMRSSRPTTAPWATLAVSCACSLSSTARTARRRSRNSSRRALLRRRCSTRRSWSTWRRTSSPR
mmetsp:Transcript_16687/g.56070  ORF Transcript_16687/g.56070 Transcript_16687/m.56070 type:complete len:258 (-) Transcript_16687:299-1072(-)